MKKLLLFLALCLQFVAVFSQNTDVAYDYPVVPGSAQWKSFKSVADMYNACQIPEKVLGSLSTKALVRTCLNYPAQSVLLLGNSPQQSFDSWKYNFNGVRELLKRPDACVELEAVYKDFDVKGYTQLTSKVERGAHAFRLSFIEVIISQDEILNKADKDQGLKLLEYAIRTYDQIKQDSLYGFYNIETTGRIIIKMAEKLGLKDAKLNSPDIIEFKRLGLVSNREDLLLVIENARKLI